MILWENQSMDTDESQDKLRHKQKYIDGDWSKL